MDVQADEAGLRPDPSTTAMLPQPVVGGQQRAPGGRRSAASGQGQLFADAYAYPTYADTDKIPAVPGGHVAPRRGPSRWLRVAVAVVALAVLAAGAALGLVKAGVIDTSNRPASTSPASTSPASKSPTTSSGAPPATRAHHAAPSAPGGTPMLTPISTGAGTASYGVDVTAYAVTVKTTTGRSWVSIAVNGQPPVFAGIVPPNSSQKEILIGAAQVDVGAGGTSVVVTSGHRSTTLTPPSAPFSYQFLPKH